MIVLDASVAVELVTNRPLAHRIMAAMYTHEGSLLAPHLLDVEVLSALRRLADNGSIDMHRIAQFLEDLALLPVQRQSHTALIHRIWELRHNFTAYDAAYVALAEATGASLYTTDEKLSKGHRAKVVVFKEE